MATTNCHVVVYVDAWKYAIPFFDMEDVIEIKVKGVEIKCSFANCSSWRLYKELILEENSRFLAKHFTTSNFSKPFFCNDSIGETLWSQIVCLDHFSWEFLHEVGTDTFFLSFERTIVGFGFANDTGWRSGSWRIKLEEVSRFFATNFTIFQHFETFFMNSKYGRKRFTMFNFSKHLICIHSMREKVWSQIVWFQSFTMRTSTGGGYWYIFSFIWEDGFTQCSFQ